MNVQVVNGSGSESTLNGEGNLVVGYDGAPVLMRSRCESESTAVPARCHAVAMRAGARGRYARVISAAAGRRTRTRAAGSGVARRRPSALNTTVPESVTSCHPDPRGASESVSFVSRATRVGDHMSWRVRMRGAGVRCARWAGSWGAVVVVMAAVWDADLNPR